MGGGEGGERGGSGNRVHVQGLHAGSILKDEELTNGVLYHLCVVTGARPNQFIVFPKERTTFLNYTMKSKDSVCSTTQWPECTCITVLFFNRPLPPKQDS